MGFFVKEKIIRLERLKEAVECNYSEPMPSNLTFEEFKVWLAGQQQILEKNMTMSKYPSINQFRNVIKDVKDRNQFVGIDDAGVAIFDRTIKLPVLKFTGTTKLHGTNAGIGFNFDDLHNYWTQSRVNIITPMKDNAGFAAYVHSRKHDFIEIFQGIQKTLTRYLENYDQFSGVVIYGEWCGGSIQKSVGINALGNMFVVFGIKLISKNLDKSANVWVNDDFIKTVIVNDSEMSLYNIFTFGQWELDIDFNEPEQIQNKLIELTEQVEKECPCAFWFGVEKSVGEGIVWSHNSIKFPNLRFKVKGSCHSSSKVKTLAPVDIEKVNSINECVDSIVTESRLNQGLEHLRMNGIELDQKNTGDFIKWVTQDCIKEEIDTILGNNLEVQDVMKGVSKKAKDWFFTQIFI